MLSIGMGLALDRYGWMMSTVPALNHTLLHAQTVVLEHITVSILRMFIHGGDVVMLNDAQIVLQNV